MTRDELNDIFKFVNNIGPWAQNIEEVWGLVQHLNELKPTRVLEIGVQAGASLRVWSDIAGPEGKVFGLDLSDATQQMTFNNPPTVLTGDSSKPETIEMVKNLIPELDFLFIDGEHYGEGPRLDWENYSPLVRSGGIVAFHDTRVGEIKAVFSSITHDKKIYDHAYGLGVVFVG
jgi:cephalosporin hydroxylase